MALSQENPGERSRYTIKSKRTKIQYIRLYMDKYTSDVSQLL